MKLNTNSKAESIEEYFNLSDKESFEIKMLAMETLFKVVKENYEKGNFRFFTQLIDEFFKKEFDSPEKLAFAMYVLTRNIFGAKERKENPPAEMAGVGSHRFGGKSLLVHLLLRSEERRVGKECRSRWSPYH